MGVSPERFCRLTGVNQSRFGAQLRDEISDALPRWYEVVLFALYHHPELRTSEGPIGLPFADWGITRQMRRCDSLKSDLLGTEIPLALEAMGVSAGQFARLGGMNPARLACTSHGADREAPPAFIEVMLFALYHHPELRISEAAIDLPVEEWGVNITD